MKMIRYADDFVILVHGTRDDARALRAEVGRVLAPMGLRLSADKTRLTHIEEGFEFLGWRIQRRKKKGTRGTTRVYTYPSKKSLASIIDRIRILTRRTAHRTLADLLRRLNPAIRGWCAYFQHGVSKRTFCYVDNFAFRRILGWLYKRHPRLNKHTVNRRFLPGWRIRDDGIEFFRACRVPVTRYRYRGTRIPSPRGGERHGITRVESRMRRNAHVRFGGRPAETHPRKRGQGAAGRPYTHVPTWSGFCCTAFVTGPVRDGRIVGRGHQHAHGAPTTRPAPWSRRSGRASTATAVISRAWSTTATTDPSHLSIAYTGRLVDEGTGRLGRKPWGPPTQAPPPRPRASPLQARGPFWRDGPWKDRDDPRDRHRPMGEPAQPHPTPPRQPRRPVTRRRRTPLPSKPHHRRRGTRHGITNPPQNPGRSSSQCPDGRGSGPQRPRAGPGPREASRTGWTISTCFLPLMVRVRLIRGHLGGAGEVHPPGGLDGLVGASHPPPVGAVGDGRGRGVLPGRVLERLVRTGLVVLDRQRVVGAPGDDPLGGAHLGAPWRRR